MNDPTSLVRPGCRVPFARRDDRLVCSAAGCVHPCEGSAKFGGKQVLIDLEWSIVDRRAFLVRGGGKHVQRNAASRWREENAKLFLLLKARRPLPVVAIVGSATCVPTSSTISSGCCNPKPWPMGDAGGALELLDQVPGPVPRRVEDGMPHPSLYFAWLQLLDGLGPRRWRLESAFGRWFLGRGSETWRAPRDFVAYYDSQ